MERDPSLAWRVPGGPSAETTSTTHEHTPDGKDRDRDRDRDISKRSGSGRGRSSRDEDAREGGSRRGVWTHQDYCQLCKQVHPLSLLSLIPSRTHTHTRTQEGELLCCHWCPRTYHIECVQCNSVPAGHWSCPQHSCAVCGRKATEVWFFEFVCCLRCVVDCVVVRLAACCSAASSARARSAKVPCLSLIHSLIHQFIAFHCRSSARRVRRSRRSGHVCRAREARLPNAFFSLLHLVLALLCTLPQRLANAAEQGSPGGERRFCGCECFANTKENNEQTRQGAAVPSCSRCTCVLIVC